MFLIQHFKKWYTVVKLKSFPKLFGVELTHHNQIYPMNLMGKATKVVG